MNVESLFACELRVFCYGVFYSLCIYCALLPGLQGPSLSQCVYTYSYGWPRDCTVIFICLICKGLRFIPGVCARLPHIILAMAHFQMWPFLQYFSISSSPVDSVVASTYFLVSIPIVPIEQREASKETSHMQADYSQASALQQKAQLCLGL